DPTGRLIVGRDSEPQNGYAPTAGWSPGEPVLDRHALLAPSVLGVYRVITGLYDPSTGRRLSATGTDFIELGRVRVVPP
ncbi:MAG TPA: hypothetical protein DEP84_19035, partial [Chloroflexi bacterium]|nr:hypothetical protein [Chloroflexota bacterium]